MVANFGYFPAHRRFFKDNCYRFWNIYILLILAIFSTFYRMVSMRCFLTFTVNARRRNQLNKLYTYAWTNRRFAFTSLVELLTAAKSKHFCLLWCNFPFYLFHNKTGLPNIWTHHIRQHNPPGWILLQGTMPFIFN